MGEPRLMKEGALYLLEALLPERIDHRQSGDFVEVLGSDDYYAMPTEDRATYDLATELATGSGPLARFMLTADGHRARVMLCVLTVAAGPITLDIAP